MTDGMPRIVDSTGAKFALIPLKDGAMGVAIHEPDGWHHGNFILTADEAISVSNALTMHVYQARQQAGAA